MAQRHLPTRRLHSQAFNPMPPPWVCTDRAFVKISLNKNCRAPQKMVGRPGQIPDLTKGSRSRSKFKGGIPRHVPLAILAETLQGDGDPHTQGELLPMFGLGTPNPRGPLIWVSGVHAAQTVCGLPGFGCCSMVGLCSRLGLCSGLGLYKGLGICSGC